MKWREKKKIKLKEYTIHQLLAPTTMAIYSFSIFDRHCNCIYNREFSSTDNGTINKNNNTDSSKLLFGVVYSLKNILSKLAGDSSIESQSSISNFLKSFSTSQFRIHYYESLTNLKFIIITDNSIDNMQNILWELYSNFYVKHISLNYLSQVDFKSEDEKIYNPNFINETDAFIKSLPVFN